MLKIKKLDWALLRHRHRICMWGERVWEGTGLEKFLWGIAGPGAERQVILHKFTVNKTDTLDTNQLRFAVN